MCLPIRDSFLELSDNVSAINLDNILRLVVEIVVVKQVSWDQPFLRPSEGFCLSRGEWKEDGVSTKISRQITYRDDRRIC